MKKLSLAIIALYLNLAAAFGQSAPTDSAKYQSRRLSFEEANLVSSYYHQDGSNAATTGGKGSEKLTDISNSIDVKMHYWDKHRRKHSLTAELGVDHYTSASSDLIDLQANSSASHVDTRFYPSLSWTTENQRRGTNWGLGAAYSSETDYKSRGGFISYAKKSKNRNAEWSAQARAYLDKVSLIYPIELRTSAGYPKTPRNSYSLSLSYSQIVNRQLQLMFIADLISQNGFLGLPFHRVYFKDATVHAEHLPGNRFKLPVGFRANYFAGNRTVLRSYYRFYTDSWGLKAHTAELEVSYKVTPFASVTPFYRFYSQSAAKYFAPYGGHTAADAYFTSNYDLSTFTSNFLGAGVRLSPPKGILGIKHLGMLELRYGHYARNISLNSNVISLNLKVK
jgi:hypothetical protein